MTHASNLAFDESPRGAGGTGATEHIAQILTDCGVDVPGSLYDEALDLARQGRLAPSAERLRMLLVLDPTDADAALLLGKVLAGRGQWQDALSQLDSAAAKGAALPRGLRDEVELRLRRQVHDDEQRRARVVARERGEMLGLRAEAKRLRSEKAMIEGQVDELSRRVKIWSSATALVAGSAAALLLTAMVFGGPAEDTTAVATPVAEEALPPSGEAPGVASVDAAPATPPTDAAPATEPAATATPAAASALPTASAPSTPPAAAPAGPTVVMHTVKKGETLGHMARRYYGKSSEWRKILQANNDQLHGSVKALRPGMRLKIPR